MNSAAPIIEIEAMVKEYPGTRALDAVNFTLLTGEVHALVGENGAGKSTLAKIISGAQSRTSGVMRFDGQPVDFRRPAEANALGIAIVHQELDLIPTLDAAENIFLGQQRFYRYGVLDRKAQRAGAQDILDRLGIAVALDIPVKRMSLAEQQLVTIAKALSSAGQRVIIMDEPTSALAHHEVEQLFQIVRRLKAQGVSFIYISHHLTELFQIADRVTVMRDGRGVLTEPLSGLTKDDIARAMVGRDVQTSMADTRRRNAPAVLQARDITYAQALHGVGFEVHQGEILGFTGLMGCGSIELAKVLFGMLQPDGGALTLAGKPLTLKSPIVAIQNGIAFVPEDRKVQGIIPRSSVSFNIVLPILKRLSRFGVVDRAQVRETAQEQVAALRIRTSGLDKAVRLLSGGNQQKVVLAKSLVARPKLLILVEPTRGVDIGAKAEIHEQLGKLAATGLSLLVFSSDLPELITISDRILTLDRGRISGEFTRGQINQTDLTAFIIGGTELHASAVHS